MLSSMLSLEFVLVTTLIVLAGRASTLSVVKKSDTLQQKIDAAIASRLPNQVVKATPGDHDFDSGVSLKIVDAHDLTVTTTANTTLYFHCGAGVHIANSSNVKFQGFVIDYRQPCFAQGVVKVGPTISTLQPKSKAAADAKLNSTKWGTSSVKAVFDVIHFPSPEFTVALADAGTIKITFWDPTTLGIIAHGNHLFENVSKSDAGATTYTVTYSSSSPSTGVIHPGVLMTVHPRLGLDNGTGVAGGLTYLITNSSRVHTVDVTLHGGATEAVVEGGGEGNHTYDNVRVVRKQGQTPVRLLAANADGFHSSCVRIGPKLLNSELSFTGDDLLNIHSRMSLVLRPLSSTSAYVIDALGSSSPADYDESTLMLQQTNVGDALAFSLLGTLTPNGTTEVTSLKRVYDKAVVAEAVAAFAEINAPPYSQHINHPFGSRVWLVNWKSPLNVVKFTIVDVPRLRSANALVRGNYFHDAYMRLGLYDSPGMVIEANRFERAFPLYVGENGDGWLEGPPMVANVTVRDNVFIDIYGTPAINFVATTTKFGTMANNTCRTAAGVTIPCGAL